MVGPVLSTLYVLTHLTQQKLYEIVIVIIPIFTDEKLRQFF